MSIWEPKSVGSSADQRSGIDLDALMERFEVAWQLGEQPSIQDFLPNVGTERDMALCELAHIDLELRIKAGEQIRVEDYLNRFPELGMRSDVILSLLTTEQRFRRRYAKDLQIGEYTRRFPQLADELSRSYGLRSLGSAPSAEGHSQACTERLPAERNQDSPVKASNTPAALTAVPRPSIVPGYEFLGELGRGGMGVVYKARQTRLNRVVALKMILSGELATQEQRRRFQAEAETVARLVHPNIVQIYEVGEHENRPYCALEYVAGPNLGQHLAGTPQSPQSAAELLEVLAHAVAAAHQRGIIHRDLKPANVLLTEDGIPKVTDFGLAKQLGDGHSETQTGMVMGTPSYMSPEQAFGRVRDIGPATDIYALGAIFYEMLTGRPPFRGEDLSDTLNQVRFLDPVPPRDLRIRLPLDLDTICLKCLQKDSSHRYNSAGELAADLRRFLDGRPIVARPVGIAEGIWRWAKRYPAIAALSTAVSVISLLSFAFVTTQLLLRIEAQKRWVNTQVDALVTSSEESIPFFVDSLSEFQQYSNERLWAIYKKPGLKRSEKVRVALALIRSETQMVDDLAELLPDATPGEVRVICDELARRHATPQHLVSLVEQQPSAKVDNELALDSFARRKANAAIAVARLGETSLVWPLLRSSSDNSVRSHIIDRWESCGGGLNPLVSRLSDSQTAEDERRSLLLMLGSIPVTALSPSDGNQLLHRLKLVEHFERASDAGIHAALRWILCRWGHSETVARIEERLKGHPRGSKDWYLTEEGHTMSVLGPAKFRMGSPTREEQREASSEQLHDCQISRTFSIGQQEVTIAQFQRFRKLQPLGGPDSMEPESPARFIKWSDAAAYCNWLSSQAGIAQNQWCYVPHPTQLGSYLPAADYLDRAGYRLPTEAEWEYACRAGANTPRFYGYSLELLPKYARCLRKDPSGRKGPVATLLPNDYGLFDVYGNAAEWCNDVYAPFGVSATTDHGGPSLSADNPWRVLRGLAAGDVAIPRSALRDRALYSVTTPALGFRIARTESP